MTKGKLLTLGAVAGAIIIAIFGFGIYGIVSCGTREYWNRRIKDAEDDDKYVSVLATVEFVEKDKDLLFVGLNYDGGSREAFAIPETKKYFKDNEFELELGETYFFTLFKGGAPTISNVIAAVSSEDGKTVYLPYEDGKQMIVDYFVSMRK